MIEIRALTSQSDFDGAVRLQKQIWGFEDVDLLPRRLFVVATKIGGHAFGAFDGKHMAAFVLAIPGMKTGAKVYLHSHMLGVLPEYRDQGLGRKLKLTQRDEALSRGVQLMEWTFDPLEIKNAFFNIERLGAVVRRYVLNQYGTTSSHLHGGLPTDRCVAEWWMDSPRVHTRLSGQPPAPVTPAARVEVPTDIAHIRQHDHARARELQAGISEQFLRYFEQGLAVTGFERGPEVSAYLFTPWDSH